MYPSPCFLPSPLPVSPVPSCRSCCWWKSVYNMIKNWLLIENISCSGCQEKLELVLKHVTLEKCMSDWYGDMMVSWGAVGQEVIPSAQHLWASPTCSPYPVARESQHYQWSARATQNWPLEPNKAHTLHPGEGLSVDRICGSWPNSLSPSHPGTFGVLQGMAVCVSQGIKILRCFGVGNSCLCWHAGTTFEHHTEEKDHSLPLESMETVSRPEIVRSPSVPVTSEAASRRCRLRRSPESQGPLAQNILFLFSPWGTSVRLTH